MLSASRKLKERLAGGGIVYSAWVTFNDPGVAEVVAGCGYDAVLVDLEHTSVSLESLQNHIAATQKWGPAVIVRVPDHTPGLIKRVLDIGADGIIAPMVMNAEQARAVVSSCRYAPGGTRGFGPRRASDYFRDTRQYVAEADAAVFVMPQIEHVAAADIAPAIAAVPGIDALCLGPMDLSATAGQLGKLDHPVVADAMDKVFDAAKAAGLAVCMGFALPPSEQARWVSKGARFVIAGDDLQVLRNGLTESLRETRRLLG